jgi:hypothetical protein
LHGCYSEIDEGTVDFMPLRRLDSGAAIVAGAVAFVVERRVGIAVGMATEIPSHNLREVAAATLLLLGKPKASLDDLLGELPAPDFPVAGSFRRVAHPRYLRDWPWRRRCARATATRNWRAVSGNWSSPNFRPRRRRSACSRNRGADEPQDQAGKRH